MPQYRRARVAGGTYFFTLVCQDRAPIFRAEWTVRLLGEILRQARQRWPFETIGIVLLPDHLHAIWSLPRGDFDYSRRWAWIKKEFSQAYLTHGGVSQEVTSSRRRNRRVGVWQRRFWEHTIQEEDELEAYLDYIHWNPVKHGYTAAPVEWPYSSFHRWMKAGLYDANWGRIPPDPNRLQSLSTGE